MKLFLMFVLSIVGSMAHAIPEYMVDADSFTNSSYWSISHTATLTIQAR